jgi:hypothetical protein
MYFQERIEALSQFADFTQVKEEIGNLQLYIKMVNPESELDVEHIFDYVAGEIDSNNEYYSIDEYLGNLSLNEGFDWDVSDIDYIITTIRAIAQILNVALDDFEKKTKVSVKIICKFDDNIPSGYFYVDMLPLLRLMKDENSPFYLNK